MLNRLYNEKALLTTDEMNAAIEDYIAYLNQVITEYIQQMAGENLKEAEALGADLMLSGHFHGGTIRLPYLGGLMTPQLQFFTKEVTGSFEHGGTAMIVNRGLGTHSVKIRLNDRPEISVIDISPLG